MKWIRLPVLTLSAAWLALITQASADVANLPAPDLRAAVAAVQRNAVKREDNGQMTRSGVVVPWQGPTASGEIVFQPIIARATDQVCDQACESPCRHFMLSADQADASRRYEGLVCADDASMISWRIAGDPQLVSVRMLGPASAQAAAPDPGATPAGSEVDTTVGGSDTSQAADAADVRATQRGLTGLGYYSGPLDGVTTPSLAASVQQFMEDERLPADTSRDVFHARLVLTAERSEQARRQGCGGAAGTVVVCGTRGP